jgi:hypothetical protein
MLLEGISKGHSFIFLAKTQGTLSLDIKQIFLCAPGDSAKKIFLISILIKKTGIRKQTFFMCLK